MDNNQTFDIETLFSSICTTKFWDHQKCWDTDIPFLTPCFLNTALVWPPILFLWINLPYTIYDCHRNSKDRVTIPFNRYNVMKMFVAILLASIELIHAIHVTVYKLFHPLNQNIDDTYVSPAQLIALWTSLSGYLLLIIYLHLQRKYGFVNSGVVWFFLLVVVLFNIISIPFAMKHRPFEHWIYLPVKLTTQVLLFIMCSFSDRNPIDTEIIKSTNMKHCPRDSSSIPSKLFFWWFNPTVTLGWRRPLVNDDLWLSRKHDSCQYLMDSFFKFLRKNSNKNQSNHNIDENTEKSLKVCNGNNVDANDDDDNDGQENQHQPFNCNLWKILSQMFWKYFLFPAVGRLATDLLQLANPIILKLLIEYTTNNDSHIWHGILFSSSFFLINMIQSWSASYQQHRFSILALRIRSTLIGAIYRKSLVLATDSRKNYNTGDIVNLMAIDSQRFIDLVRFANYIWTSPVLIIIGFYLLYQEMGWAVSGGFILMFLLIPLQGYLTRTIKSIQIKQMKQKDRRLQAINELLNGMKVLKLYAWENAFVKNLNHIRSIELKQIRFAGLMTTFYVIVAVTSPFLITFLVFTVYIKWNGMLLTSEKAFVTIALFNLLRVPLSALPNMMTSLILTIVSMKRINTFLNANELEYYVKRRTMENDAIRIDDASFSWERHSKDSEKINGNLAPTLSNITVQIPKGKLIAIVGQVGSGKSSFLNAILGEMHKIKGSVSISDDQRIAYVSQQAWIQNLTARENILFGLPYEQEKYNRVIKACALKTDFEMLGQGDQTEIGEKGINLSGGQKQRISIARACYSDADIFLLDDPLSAVDSHVGKHIFQSVISSNEGILRDKTRVLVTNALYVLPLVDEVILLKNGKIAAIGSCQNLSKENEAFKELMENYHPAHGQTITIDKHEKHSLKNDDNHSRTKRIFSRNFTSESLISDTASISSISTVDSLEEESDEFKNKSTKKLIETESIETGYINWNVYKKFFQSLTYKWTIIIVAGYTLYIVPNCGANFWLSYWTNYVDQNQTDRGYELWIYLSIGITQLAFIAIGWSSIVLGCLHASRTLHERLISSIVHAPMYFFDTTPLGRIMNRFSRDIDLLDNNMALLMRIYLIHSLNVIATLFIISYQTPIFLAFVVPFVIAYVFIQRFYVCTSRQLKRIESVSRSPIFTHFSETLNGVSIIKAFDADERFINESNARVDKNFQCFYPCQVADCWLLIRLEFLANLLIFFASFIATIMKLMNDDGSGLTGSQIGLSLSYALNITLSLNQAVRISAEFENTIVSVERIDEYIKVEPEADWYTDIDDDLIENWPSNGSITMENYATRYRPGLDLVLKGIDLSISAGEKIGIVGRTGAGKSSLTLGLFRIIEAAQGKITIDNIDISQLGLNKLRSRLTIIPQDPVLFMGTIRYNLDPFNQYSDEQIWNCLELSHLKQFVSSLESGLNYRVTEAGENLSVGQRQLFCLTRALLRRTNVLILDEATAAVDFETDALIQATIRKEFSHCTILTIAHRLNTIMDSDRVLVLDAGHIAEFDSPKSLLSNRSSIFSSLAKDAGITHYSFDKKFNTNNVTTTTTTL